MISGQQMGVCDSMAHKDPVVALHLGSELIIRVSSNPRTAREPLSGP